MTRYVEPLVAGADAVGEVPVVVGIALDHGRRRRLASLLDGVGVVMFARDLATARSMLGRQADLAGRVHDAPASPVVRAGDLEIDRVRCRARWRGVPLELTQRERELLACLASPPARVWTYQELYAAAWTGRYLDAGPVHAAIKRLRRKLRQAGVDVQVNAVRGVGYELGHGTEGGDRG
ncbi:MAG: winged helix-turn-helix domain-containing protein [Micromonosporaceae bacterium]|jgi:two-component system response regulator MtrA